MKFVLYGLHRGESTAPDTLARQAKLAEAAGFDALWVGDHIALPRELGAAAELPRHEALVALTYLAAVTTMVKLGVGVLVLPQRRAVKSGNGWYGWQLDLQETADALAALRETSNNYERSAELGELEITITPRAAIDHDTARRYTDLGVHQLAIQPSSTNASAMDELITMAGDSLIGRL